MWTKDDLEKQRLDENKLYYWEIWEWPPRITTTNKINKILELKKTVDTDEGFWGADTRQ